MSVTTRPITAEQLLAMGDIGRCELINGEIIHMAPAGAEHGGVAMQLAFRIKEHADRHGLGKVYAAETGFILRRGPDHVRAPDVAFVRTERLPRDVRRGFFDGPPDLAVEVVSPSDPLSDVAAKVDDWLSAGTVSVWVVDPPNRIIAVYRQANQVLRYRDADELRDEPCLPGLAVRLADVFAP
jgi:Uma2 family endonuclease